MTGVQTCALPIYSIMAVGIAKFMGINLMDNFKSPYFAISIIDFWRRWHISLTNWFREYVYFSLGGNKVMLSRWMINILLVFSLSGLWHGASWNFVFWGLAHGVLYLIQMPLDKIVFKNKVIVFLMILLNFILVSLVWIFFRAKDMKAVSQLFSGLYTNKTAAGNLILAEKIPYLLVLFLFLEVLFNKSRIDNWLENKKGVVRWSFYSILIAFIFLFSEIKTKPFIYFQF